jgi:hypothetical protein
MNALTFYFMAPPVLQILGNVSFLALYLGGTTSVSRSTVSLLTDNILLFRIVRRHSFQRNHAVL